MNRTVRRAAVLLAAAALLTAPELAATAPPEAPRTFPGRVSPEAGERPAVRDTLYVPFLPQDLLLCGGASAAMIERYHGRRGVYAAAYDHLVRPEAGGIVTVDLAAELERRGFHTRVREGDPRAAVAALRGRAPPILLLEARGPLGSPTGFHYVVLVGWEDGFAFLNDPLFGPARPIPTDELLRRWSTSDYWTLIATPERPLDRASSGRSGGARPVERTVGLPDEASPAATPDRTAHPVLVDALELLRSGDLAGAEAVAAELVRAHAGERSPEDPPPAEREVDPADRATAWRLIATARYRDGRAGDALRAWNRVGEPTVDLVHIDGVRTHRWPAVARRLPVQPGAILSSGALGLARRRLAAVPGVRSSRVDYQPLPDGSVELRAAVAERRRLPSWPALARASADAVLDEEAELGAGPLLSGAERWIVGGRWLRGAPAAYLSLAAPTPPLPGVATVTLQWDRQDFLAGAGVVPDGAPSPPFEDGASRELHREEVLSARLTIREWVTGGTRLLAGVGLERWTTEAVPGAALVATDGRRLRVDAGIRQDILPGTAFLDAEGTVWTGPGLDFARSRISLHAVAPGLARGRWRLTAGATHASNGAPPTVWDGAGTGSVRTPHLRGERLLDDGAIGGAAFGRLLAHGSVERVQPLLRFGPGELGALVLADLTGAREGPDADGRLLAALGFGLEVDTGERRISLTAATGRGAWILTARSALAPRF